MIPNLKYKILFILCILLLTSLQLLNASSLLNSPIGLQNYTCKFLDNQTVDIAELSGLTYNPDDKVLMAITDEGEILELAATERKVIAETGGSNCSNPNSLPAATKFNDTEAIVHIGNDLYGIMEEREARISLVTIDGFANTLDFPQNSTYDLTINNNNNTIKIPTCNNHGLEGLAYDKANGDFYTIKQANPLELYTFKLPANSAQVTMTAIVDLSNILIPYLQLPLESVHGLHHDNISGNLLLIGTFGNGNSNHGDNKRVLIEITTNGDYVSHLHLEMDLSTEFSSGSTYNIEGVTMIGDKIILIGEKPSSSESKMYGLIKNKGATPVSLNIKVMLEGSFHKQTGDVRTDLFTRAVLPGQSNNTIINGHPYSNPPYNYTGTEGANWSAYPNNTVDWVLISFREKEQSDQFLSMAGILEDDGQITFPFPNPKVLQYADFPISNEFYITIQHRNHLMIMSKSRIRLHNMTIERDFTTSNSYTDNQSGTGQVFRYGHFCMAAGDIDKNSDIIFGDINGNDKIIWDSNNGQFNVYSDSDTSLNADVNGDDKILFHNNNGLFNKILKL